MAVAAVFLSTHSQETMRPKYGNLRTTKDGNYFNSFPAPFHHVTRQYNQSCKNNVKPRLSDDAERNNIAADVPVPPETLTSTLFCCYATGMKCHSHSQR